jgi:2-oxopent-4-enoate/cis-2-oxohex-4-enoate hydratase
MTQTRSPDSSKADSQLVSQLAETLWQARISGTPCAPLTVAHPELTIEDAYRISSQNFQRRLMGAVMGAVMGGVKSVGRKIGLTSLAVQKQLGVNQPDFGYLTSDMLVHSGDAIGKNALIQGRAEGEVAFILGRDLKGPGVTREDVIAATDHVVACIEIIDSRVKDWKIKIQDTISDNASSALLVLGNKPRKLQDLDLRMAGMALRMNGEVESSGVGAACLDHPVNAVVWLANALGALGDPLKAGDIILSGAYGPVVPFNPGDHCEVENSGLGKVSCSRESK